VILGVTLLKIATLLLVLDIWGVYFEFLVVDQSRRVLKEAEPSTEVTPVENLQNEEGEDAGEEDEENKDEV
jgi:hypothetical protein